MESFLPTRPLPQLFKSLSHLDSQPELTSAAASSCSQRSVPGEVPVHILSSGPNLYSSCSQVSKADCLSLSFSYPSLKVNVVLSRVTEPGKRKMGFKSQPSCCYLCVSVQPHLSHWVSFSFFHHMLEEYYEIIKYMVAH